MTENSDGILGNLPRSRPGVRSEKRAGGPAAPKRSAAKPQPAAAAKPKPAASRAKPAAAKARAASAKPPPPPPRPKAPPPKEPDTVERAVRLVGDVAETGIKVAAKVAGGVLRRLPRP
jgi:hypothetical protein